MSAGKIIAGCLAPHPPHLVYALNPEANEPEAEETGAFKPLLQGYQRLRESLRARDFDVLVVHTPHWKTVVGHHFLGVPGVKGVSVEPTFPNLFRFHYDLKVDVELAEEIAGEARARGLVTTMMRNPDFQVDYGTLASCELSYPAWDKPLVVVSSASPHSLFSVEVGDAQMLALGEATRAAIEKSGRRAVLLGSTSLSHRHFTEEPDSPEDPRLESIYNANQAAWDAHILGLLQQGECARVLAEMPDFIEQATSECREGSLSWLLGALGIPDYPATLHGYGSVIGTGNGIVEWSCEEERE